MITLAIISPYGIIFIIAYLVLLLPAIYVVAKHEQSPFLLPWMFLLILLPVVGVVVYTAVYITRKKRRDRFEIMPGGESEEQGQRHEDQKTPAGIPEDTVTHILNNLESFEKEEAYLKPGISLAGLAGDFDVGSGQLSKTIKLYKKKSFNGYINTLRVDYLVKELRSGSDYRKYRMKPLAKELGFSSEAAFTIAFLKRTGMYPTLFIKGLGFGQKQQWAFD